MIYRIYDANQEWGEWEGEDHNDAVMAMLADYIYANDSPSFSPDLDTLRADPK